jgi:hypothetical protein
VELTVSGRTDPLGLTRELHITDNFTLVAKC